MATHIYAAHMDRVLKMAAREGGVSRPQIMDELNVSRPVAVKLIAECKLEKGEKQGRTEFFTTNGATPEPAAKAELPPEVEDAAVAEPSPPSPPEDPDETIAQLDAEIVDTRDAMREACNKAAKAMQSWATNQAMVDALRERMQDLAKRRMDLCT
jgi:hypothetical protein